MEIKKGTLVIVLPHKLTGPHPMWGLVEQRFLESGYFQVRTGEKEHNFVISPPEKLIPILQTNGVVKTPASALKKFKNEILIWILCKIHKEEEKEKEIDPGTLVVVLPKPGVVIKPCWGIVIKRFKENYDVRIGFRKKVFVPQRGLIPVLKVKNTAMGPNSAVRQNLPDILLLIILRLLSQKLDFNLQKILSALSSL